MHNIIDYDYYKYSLLLLLLPETATWITIQLAAKSLPSCTHYEVLFTCKWVIDLFNFIALFEHPAFC